VEPGGAPRELHPASPCRPSWAGAWYNARQGEVPPRRIRHLRGDGLRSTSVLWTDAELTRPRRDNFRMAARRQRRAARPRQRARKGAPLHRFGPRGRNRAPWTASAPSWRREAAMLAATSVAEGEPLGFVPTETKRDARTPQGARAVEVDVSASAPPTSGPGIPTCARSCAGTSPRLVASPAGHVRFTAVRPLLVGGRVWPRWPASE
jgi:hypothetical protein